MPLVSGRMRCVLTYPLLCAALVLFVHRSSAEPQTSATRSAVFNIRNYGALGDNKANDTAAIQRTIDACAAAGGGTVRVPPGTYLARGILLKSHVTLNLDEGALIQGPSDVKDYPLYGGREKSGWSGSYYGIIGAEDATNVAITGAGRIDAAGQHSWAIEHQKRDQLRAGGVKLKAGASAIDRPRMIQFLRCSQIAVSGVTLSNSQMWNLVFNQCQNIHVDGVNILEPAESPETDGIDLRGSRHALVTHCRIDNGDDNIAITGSRSPIDDDQAASQDIEIRDCTFLHGHGVSIGSPTMNGVRDVRVHDCTFTGTTNGIRIKSMRERGGTVEDIHYDNLKMTDVNPAITINAYYQKPPATDPGQPMAPLTPVFRNIRITNLTATCPKAAGMIIGLPESQVSDIVLTNVNIQSATGLTLRNVKAISFVNVQIQPREGPVFITDAADPTN